MLRVGSSFQFLFDDVRNISSKVGMLEQLGRSDAASGIDPKDFVTSRTQIAEKVDKYQSDSDI